MSIFSTVQKAKVKKTPFNLSHEKKLTMKIGKLVPILCEEVVPGDKFKINTETMIRLAPLVAPAMTRMNAYVHYFFVPNRITWEHWEDFITGNVATTVPQLSVSMAEGKESTIYDYMGIPTNLPLPLSNINALPFRAYKQIYNDYYADENLDFLFDMEADDYQELQTRAWAKDYFTSSLPWAQKGGEVSLPIKVDYTPDFKTPSTFENYGVGSVPNVKLATDASGNIIPEAQPGNNYYIDNINSQELEGGFNINDFRLAHRLQRWLERNARAGSRYVEHLKAHWGVSPKDSRLQRAEYLGGGKSPVMISEVLNTMGRTEEDPEALAQGNMSGHGINVGKTNGCTKYVEEHGYIMAILSVMPEACYFQGIHKKFSRVDNLDYYFPEFARLGEQEVLNKELYAQGNINDDETFGYQSRFAEYKYAQSTVHGNFRGDLMYWHQARNFSAPPQLNRDFIHCEDDNRIFAYKDNESDNLWVNIYHNITAIRPMPYYADPSL